MVLGWRAEIGGKRIDDVANHDLYELLGRSSRSSKASRNEPNKEKGEKQVSIRAHGEAVD